LKKINSNNASVAPKRSVLFIQLVLFFDLVFIYLHKYIFRDLPLSEFYFFRIGNLLNFLFFIIPALGILILNFKSNKIEGSRYYFLITLLTAMNLPLLGYIITSKFRIKFPIEYILQYPVEKVYIAVLFIIYGILSVILSVFIWFSIIHPGRKLFLKIFTWSLITVIVLIIFSFIYSSNFIKTADFSSSNLTKADVAVVLGAAVWSKNKASPILESRIDKASELYKEKKVDKILVTGGKAPGEISEARVAKNYLISNGVKVSDILLEENSSSTSEQIKYVKSNLVEENNFKNIIVISDQVHLKRVIEICKFYNVRVKGVASDLKLSWEKSFVYRLRDSIALLLFWLYAI
jgi:vancomycin permeability regulator SanA